MEPLASKLNAIYPIADQQVWKGFTDKRDSELDKHWTCYHLFVNLDKRGIDQPTHFKILGVNKFEMKSFKYKLKTGFKMQVKATS